MEEKVIEVDFGNWTGQKISSLARKKEWKIVQNSPEDMVFPDGESLKALQLRALSAVASLSRTRGSNPKLIVTHADVIKAILSGLLASGLKDFQKFAVDPASISIIDYDKKGSRILTLNNTHSKLIDLLDKK
ncbi:unannotated protein [freshwater metagenome]|uniref:Unannotated protein n=1 Tax=freshwater metagenome TaxID=449393 RepID=A0A6J7DS62_9ZZZZ